jgi:hypothetical protein
MAGSRVKEKQRHNNPHVAPRGKIRLSLEIAGLSALFDEPEVSQYLEREDLFDGPMSNPEGAWY